MAMVFPTSPTVGQVFTSGSRSWVWNGSAWDSPAGQPFIVPGLTLLNSTSFTSQTTINIDNVFSADYDYYKIFSVITGTSNQTINFNLRASGSTISTSTYMWQRLILRNASFFNANNTSVTAMYLADAANAVPIMVETLVGNPFKTTQTHFMNNVQSASSTVSMDMYWGRQTDSTSTTGFALSCANAITGTIKIYGLRN
jgi:hypothetical protein